MTGNDNDTDIRELKELVRQAIAYGQENNAILSKMQRSARWNSFFRLLYWLIIIGLSIGAFYFIQPYVNSLESAMSSLTNANSSTSQQNATQNAAQNIENALKKL